MTVIERQDLGLPRGDDRFPLCLQHEGDTTLEETLAWIAHERESLLAQAARYGTILFRGFGVASDQDFDAFIQAFGLPNFTYAEAPRWP